MFIWCYYSVLVTWHYVSRCSDHSYSTFDSFVYWYIDHSYNCYNCFHLNGVSSNFGSEWCSYAPITDSNQHSERYIWLHYCVTVSTSVTHAFSGLYQLNHGPPQVSFLFQSWWCHPFSFMLVIVSMFAFFFEFQCGHVGLNYWDLHHYNPLEYTHARHVCLLMLVQVQC